jgi:hypothetical protein
MLFSSGFRGASRISTPRNMRRLRIHGFGAYFGDYVDESGYVHRGDAPPEVTEGGSTYDVGSMAAGIGQGIGSVLTGIGTVLRGTQQAPTYQPRTYGYGEQPRDSGFGISPGMLAAGAVLLVGVVMLSKKS